MSIKPFSVFHNSLNIMRNTIGVMNSKFEYFEFPIYFENNVYSAQLGEFGLYKEILSQEKDMHVGSISIDVQTDEPFILYCPFEFPKTETQPYFQIPGFLYGTNNAKGSDGKQPKFEYGGTIDWPASSKFYTRADRSTHNNIITVHNSYVFSIGIQEKLDNIEYERSNEWESRYAYNGLMLDTSFPQKDIVGFTIGYEHFPKRYTWEWDDPITPKVDEFLHGWIYGQKGKTITTKSFYYCNTAEEGIPAYGKALEAYYNIIHELPKVRATRNEAMRFCIDAIIENGWNKEHSFFVLSDNSEEGKNRGNTGWTGGMQVAYPILKAGITLQESKYTELAIQYMNNLVATGMNEKAHLLYEEFRDGKWSVDGWWGRREDCYNWGDNPLHSAYVNGQAAYYLLKSYIDTGKKYTSWLTSAQIILQTALASQQADGSIARFYNSTNGNPIDYTGFQACWFVPGLILLATISNDTIILEKAQKALDYYFSFHTKGELYGTPMDTHEAVDEEGNLAFIIACVEMHKITHQEKYIDFVRIAFDYEFSWKFPYNTAFSNEPLRSLEWCSCGGSITSTHNPHIHPMGNLVAGELWYVYTQTKNNYYAQRLQDTCIWGLSTFNTHNFNFGFGGLGFETEQFFHSDALLLPWWKKWDGGIWEAYLPWASGCVILNATEQIPDDFFTDKIIFNTK